MNLLRVAVWCGLLSGGIIGPYDDGATITVHGDTHRSIITYFYVPALYVNDVWFQQDGAT